MAQQSTGPTWTRLLTIALYLIFASLPALSFAIFYACLWVWVYYLFCQHTNYGCLRLKALSKAQAPIYESYNIIRISLQEVD